MTRLGNYELGEEIGRGNNGRVFRARDRRDGREAAVKVVPWPRTAGKKERHEVLERFRREAEVTGKLAHPSIVHGGEAGVAGGKLWIAMELAGGTPLSDFVDQGRRLEPRRLIRVVNALSEALEHVHAHGIVHRDVRPENVILQANDGVKLLDFGHARVADSSLTASGEFLGSPHTIAPEQMMGEKPGPAADQYSLAVMTYHLLTGAWPFPGKDPSEIFEAALNRPPAPLSEHRPELPGAIGRALVRALARDPESRFPGARAFAVAFGNAFAEETILPPRDPANRSDHGAEARPAASADFAVPSLNPEGGAARTADPKTGNGRVRESAGWRRRSIAIAVLLALLVSAWALANAPWSREERIARRAERGDLTGAQAALDRWAAADPEDAALALAEGHVAFARKDVVAGLTAYRRASTADGWILGTPRALENLERSLDFESARAGLLGLAEALPDRFDRRLWKHVQSDEYWRRWNSARTLEARGFARKLDWTELYISDLRLAGSCGTRKRAAERLGELGDDRALPALRAAREDSRNRFCFMGRTLDQAIGAIEQGQ